MKRPFIRRNGVALGGATLLLGAVACGLIVHAEWARRQPDRRFQRGWRAFEDGNLHALEHESGALELLEHYQPHAHLLRGAYLVRLGMNSEAIESLAKALGHVDTKAYALLLAGQAFHALELAGEAQRVLRAALLELPEHPDVHRWLGISYYDTGASLHALAHLKKLAELEPLNGLPHRLAASIYKDDERYSLAVDAYREALRCDLAPDERKTIFLDLADSLMKLQHHDEALKVLSECPESARSVALQAECWYGQGRAERARRLAERALEQDSRQREAQLVLAAVHLDAGRIQAARDVLVRAAESYPNDPVVRFRLSQAHLRLGETAEAEEQLQLMETLRSLLARFAELQEESMNNPDDAGIRYELGVHARELGESKLAATWFQAALSLDPAHAAARRALLDLTRTRDD